MKRILTNYLFRFLFCSGENYRAGELIECQGDLFIFDSSNGNSNPLKFFIRRDGFWNYIRAKRSSIYNMEAKRFLTDEDLTSQGYIGNEYYKNLIRRATREEAEEYYRYVLKSNRGEI